jgi:thiamine-monophosphate kinase
MNEFEIIDKYFRPLSEGHDDFQNDAAVLKIPEGHELIVTSDAAISGTHFVTDASPENIAHKSLRRNLSDLAAMGATPLAYQLNIAFPVKPQESWLSAFTGALLRDQKEFGIYCSGGDTTSTSGPLSINITAMGLVPSGKDFTRKGAKPGDHIILTGPVGDAFIGLLVLQKKIKTVDNDYFINAAFKPTPRTALVDILRDIVNAAIDISDGLVADLNYICKASNCGADIQAVAGIFSAPALKTMIPPSDLLTGGDDYELLLAVPPANSESLLKKLTTLGLAPVKIGEFAAGQGVKIRDQNGQPITVQTPGWRHF